jgi:AcrR family transcriptional regulator
MKKDQRKRQIMEVALKLFARQGYHLTSVADIISEMGVARGTFYRYFNDKHDLFNQLLENNFRYVKRVLPAIPEDRPVTAGDLEAVLTVSFRELLSQPNSREFMTMMVNEAAGVDRLFAQKVNAFYDDLAEVFSGYISRVQNEGLIVNHDSQVLSYLILGALKEMFIQWARGYRFEDLEVLIHEVSSFIVFGVSPRERAES